MSGSADILGQVGVTDDIRETTSEILATPWSKRKGEVVPKTEDVALKGGAVELDAVILYADLRESTRLAREFPHTTAARVVRAYLSTMTRLVNHHGGKVRSFDGDRVMGVFLGESKNTSATKCAFSMNWAMENVIRPKVDAKFPALAKAGFQPRHCVGIHGDPILVVRAGVRGSNDLVLIGGAPNIAAKLSDIREGTWNTFITWSVHRDLHASAKANLEGGTIWHPVKRELSGSRWSLYRADYWRRP